MRENREAIERIESERVDEAYMAELRAKYSELIVEELSLYEAYMTMLMRPDGSVGGGCGGVADQAGPSVIQLPSNDSCDGGMDWEKLMEEEDYEYLNLC